MFVDSPVAREWDNSPQGDEISFVDSDDAARDYPELLVPYWLICKDGMLRTLI